MEDKWIDSIKDKMAEYEAIPPAGLLDSVQACVKARRRRRRIFFFIAASVALLCCISVALIPDNIEYSQSLASKVDAKTGKKGNSGPEEEKPFVADTLLPSSIHGGRRVVTALTSNKKAPVSPTEIRVVQEAEGIDIWENELNQDNDLHQSSGDQERLSVNDRYEELSDCVYTDVTPHSVDPELSVGVLTSANGLGGMLNDDNIGFEPAHDATSMPLTRMGGGVLEDAFASNSPVPRFIEIFDHKLPVRFSLDFSWTLPYGLNVGTGVSYSYLRSDISYGYSDTRLSKATQNLHYLGIPVNLRYTPWRFNKFSVYASVGFMAEKCIAGNIKEENPSAERYSYVGCDDRPFQFSFNAAAGLQYSLAKSCAVFVEPGVGIYLKDGSRLRTIYSERPLTFNLNVGLRFGHP